MSDQNLVYGVFAEMEKAVVLVARLHKAGFSTSQLGVFGTRGTEFKHVSAKLQDPSARNFLNWGAFGCIGGLAAGIAGSAHIPNVPFQILVPLMAAISGGVVLAYFGCLMGVFLNSSKPQHWANSFEVVLREGSIIVLAECASAEQMKNAMDIMQSEDALELVVRRRAIEELLRFEYPSKKLTADEAPVRALSAVA